MICKLSQKHQSTLDGFDWSNRELERVTLSKLKQQIRKSLNQQSLLMFGCLDEKRNALIQRRKNKKKKKSQSVRRKFSAFRTEGTQSFFRSRIISFF